MNADDDDAQRMDPPPKAREKSLRGDDEEGCSEKRSPARPGPEGGRWMNGCMCDELCRLRMDDSVTFGRRG